MKWNWCVKQWNSKIHVQRLFVSWRVADSCIVAIQHGIKASLNPVYRLLCHVFGASHCYLPIFGTNHYLLMQFIRYCSWTRTIHCKGIVHLHVTIHHVACLFVGTIHSRTLQVYCPTLLFHPCLRMGLHISLLLEFFLHCYYIISRSNWVFVTDA